MCDDNDNGFFQFLPARKSPDLLISALRKAALPCLRRRCLLVRFGDHQGTVSRITNYALWVCWDCTGPEVYPVHSGALDQYWSGFVPHHLFMTRRRGVAFCPPKTDFRKRLALVTIRFGRNLPQDFAKFFSGRCHGALRGAGDANGAGA